ncbi:MAG TPA: SpoIIE family protein phosphatase, partial [Gemmatimonadaceae bacterium]
LYAVLVLINTALSGALWLGSRDPLHRGLLLVWASTLVSYVLQGALTQNTLVMTYAFVSVFFVNLSLASLVARTLSMPFRWRPLAYIVAGAVVLSTALFGMHAPFSVVALPVAVTVSLPSLVIAVRVARAWRSVSVVTRALVISCVVFSLHNIDWAFLRNRPELATFGFTVATIIIFALSITALAVVLETSTQRQARVDAEVEAARRIQTKLLPRAIDVPGLEIAAHMHAADVVGGDYFDVRTTPDGAWLFLGDVTGHGLGAGLVTLMAQSTVTSILEARPDVRPRELNYLANRVLSTNLERLGEQRHMTFVALRRLPAGEFAVSGSHDTIFVHRARTGAIEPIELSHFPFGLGFSGELDADAFGESMLTLGAGDLLFIGSDGITEAARDGQVDKGMFGEQAVVALISEYASRPVGEMSAALLERLESFTGGVYYDDISYMIVRATSGTMGTSAHAIGVSAGAAAELA